MLNQAYDKGSNLNRNGVNLDFKLDYKNAEFKMGPKQSQMSYNQDHNENVGSDTSILGSTCSKMGPIAHKMWGVQ